MCRNIKVLYNYEPPASGQEITDAALQFVRKVSGMRKPSHQNELLFQQSVNEIADSVERLLNGLTTPAPAKNRADEELKRQQRSKRRFG